MPIWVLDYGFGPAEFRIYIAISSYASAGQDCRLTTEDIAKRAGVARGTARNSIQRLRQMGIIKTEPFYRADGSFGGYRYIMVDSDPIASGLVDPDQARSAMRSTGQNLYRYFDAEGRLLYVGITGNPANRRQSHSVNSRWYTLTSGDPSFELFATRAEAAKAEKCAIESEQPLFNSADPDAGARLLDYLRRIGRTDLTPTRFINSSARA